MRSRPCGKGGCASLSGPWPRPHNATGPRTESVRGVVHDVSVGVYLLAFGCRQPHSTTVTNPHGRDAAAEGHQLSARRPRCRYPSREHAPRCALEGHAHDVAQPAQLPTLDVDRYVDVDGHLLRQLEGGDVLLACVHA
jgi:hypothetical protein